MKTKARNRKHVSRKQKSKSAMPPYASGEELEMRHKEYLADIYGATINSNGRVEGNSWSQITGNGRRLYGKELPRMNLFVFIKSSKEELREIVSYWKSLSGMVSYFMANEEENTILIGYYAKSKDDGALELAKYDRFLHKGRFGVVYPYSSEEDYHWDFTLMQIVYDQQVFYDNGDRLDFFFNVVKNGRVGISAPISIELLTPDIAKDS